MRKRQRGARPSRTLRAPRCRSPRRPAPPRADRPVGGPGRSPQVGSCSRASASEVSSETYAGFPTPRRATRCSTRLSRSSAVRCGRTALSVSSSAAASSLTVRLDRRSRAPRPRPASTRTPGPSRRRRSPTSSRARQSSRRSRTRSASTASAPPIATPPMPSVLMRFAGVKLGKAVRHPAFGRPGRYPPSARPRPGEAHPVTGTGCRPAWDSARARRPGA